MFDLDDEEEEPFYPEDDLAQNIFVDEMGNRWIQTQMGWTPLDQIGVPPSVDFTQ